MAMVIADFFRIKLIGTQFEFSKTITTIKTMIFIISSDMKKTMIFNLIAVIVKHGIYRMNFLWR